MKQSLQLFLNEVVQRINNSNNSLHEVYKLFGITSSDLKANDNKNSNDKTIFKIYENIANTNFKTIFIHLHSELNKCFEHMNYKFQSNGHYNAQQSRDLLNAINLFNDLQFHLKNSEFTVILNADYLEKIKEVYSWLQGSYGSAIPQDYKPLTIIKYEPIFTLRSATMPQPHKNIEKDVDELIKEAQEDLQNGKYGAVITLSRTILETTFKKICNKHNLDFDSNNIVKTFGNVRMHFGMDSGNKDFPNHIKCLISNTITLVQNLSEARNKSSTSHAPEYKPKKHHAQFCLEQAISLVNFIIAVDEFTQKKSGGSDGT